jgi:hypothetical protein
MRNIISESLKDICVAELCLSFVVLFCIMKEELPAAVRVFSFFISRDFNRWKFKTGYDFREDKLTFKRTYG